MPEPEPQRRRLPLLAALIVALASACTATQADVASRRDPPPTASPSASADPAAAASGATHAAATASPTVVPSATPDPAALELEVTGCPGGVVLAWSASTHPDFHHYTALRSPNEEIAPDWPPIAPAVDWGDTYATDRFVTSGADASIIPTDTTWHYRVMAYDPDDRPVSASPVRSARLLELVDLGALDLEPDGGETTRLSWSRFEGPDGCFSSYRVLSSTSGTPSNVITVISDPSTTELLTDALHPGTTYRVRVEAVRTTTLGRFVVGQTEIATYTPP